MPETTYRNRKAVQCENDDIRLTVLVEGGHIAEFRDKASGVNPMWTPPWPSIEPSTWDVGTHPEYGNDAESKLLSGIMGHNICIDLFGGPSPEEAAAGVTVHGEASIAPYDIEEAGDDTLHCTCYLRRSHLVFRRTLTLAGNVVRFVESVENLDSWDRPIAWQQHVSLGPPFIERGKGRLEITAAKSRTYEGDFGDLFNPGVVFDWPFAPVRDGGSYDLRVFSNRAQSAGYTAHLMDPGSNDASFEISSPDGRVVFGYRWKRSDFPWLGIWEENAYRKIKPWNGETIARGIEFGVSPQPESRRAMVSRASMFDVPTYRWIPARTTVTVSYEAFIGPA